MVSDNGAEEMFVKMQEQLTRRNEQIGLLIAGQNQQISEHAEQINGLIAAHKEQTAQQSQKITALEAAQATTKPPQSVNKGGVWVSQWRTTMFQNKTTKIDEQKQYYDSDKFDQLNTKDDRGRSGFENLGISYEITEDLRN